jgi:hypothetical protein
LCAVLVVGTFSLFCALALLAKCLVLLNWVSSGSPVSGRVSCSLALTGAQISWEGIDRRTTQINTRIWQGALSKMETQAKAVIHQSIYELLDSHKTTRTGRL